MDGTLNPNFPHAGFGTIKTSRDSLIILSETDRLLDGSLEKGCKLLERKGPVSGQFANSSLLTVCKDRILETRLLSIK